MGCCLSEIGDRIQLVTVLRAAVLQVADFLQDQVTASAAAEYGHSLLFLGAAESLHGVTASQALLHHPTRPVAKEDVEALLSLDAPLAEAILRAGERFH